MLKKILIMLLFSLLATLAIDYAFYSWAISEGKDLSGHAYFALALGLFFTFTVTAALSMLAFESARSGHDDEAHNAGTSEVE